MAARVPRRGPGPDEREFDMAENGATLYTPLGLLAELTHRCPLGCPYCSKALALGASRVEIAHVQYYGWALKNRASLMPSAEQAKRAAATVEELRRRHHGKIVIDAVVPDYYARFPKPCVGGWGRRSLNVTPAGKVLPCHAAESIPGLEFWSVREHSLADIWAKSPAFNAFRGTAWMQEAMRKLCAARGRFRRLPLPGVRAHR